MPDYVADIGSWEKGQTEPFQALNREDAINVVFKIRDEKFPGQDDVLVVQIKEQTGKTKTLVFWDTFWDYINGRLDL